MNFIFSKLARLASLSRSVKEGFKTVTSWGQEAGGSFQLEEVELKDKEDALTWTVKTAIEASESADFVPLVNERVLGPARVAVDIDVKITESEAQAIAFALGKNIRYHLKNYHTSLVIVTRNAKGNTHIRMPGLVGMRASDLQKLYGLVRSSYGHAPEIDLQPMVAQQMRMTGTSKGSPDDVYKFYCAFGENGKPMMESEIRPSDYLLTPTVEQLKTFAFAGPPVARSVPASRHVRSYKLPAEYVCQAFDGVRHEEVPWLLASGRTWFVARCDDMAVIGRMFDTTKEYPAGVLPVLITYRDLVADNQTLAIEPLENPGGSIESFHRNGDMSPKVKWEATDPEPVEYDNLVDIPIEALPMTNGVSLKDGDFRRFSESSYGNLSMERLVEMFADYMGHPLSHREKNLLFTRVITKELGACRSSFTGKPFMPLGFGVRPTVPHKANAVVIHMVQAPCDAGKTNYVMAKALLNWTPGDQILIVAPRQSLLTSLKPRVERLIREWDTNQRLMEQREPGYSAIELQHKPKEVVLYSEAGDGELEKADIGLVTMESLAAHYKIRRDGIKIVKTIIIDEAETTIKGLLQSSTMKREKQPEYRRKTIDIFLTMMAQSKRMFFIDKDMTLTVKMFIAIGVANMKAMADLQFKNMRPVMFQRSVLRDNKQYKFRVTTRKEFFINEIEKDIEGDKRLIIFHASRKGAEGLYEHLRAKFNDKNLFLLTGESVRSLKESFASEPIKFLKDNEIDVFIHTSTIDVGVSIECRGGYFHKAKAFVMQHVTKNQFLQAVSRARELVDEEGARTIDVCQYRMFKPDYVLPMPSMGEALYGLGAKIAVSTVEGRFSQEFIADRRVLLRLRVSTCDAVTFLACSVSIATEMECHRHLNIFEQWAEDSGVQVINVDGRAEEGIKKELADADDVAHRKRLRTSVVSTLDEDPEAKMKHRLLLSYGLTRETDEAGTLTRTGQIYEHLSKCPTFMVYAKDYSQIHMWILYGLHKFMDRGLPELMEVETQRFAATEAFGAKVFGDDGGGLYSAVLLLHACLSLLGLTQHITMDVAGVLNRRGNIPAELTEATVTLPWNMHTSADKDTFFSQLSTRPLGGMGASVLKGALSFRTRKIKYTRGMHMGEKALSHQASFCRKVVSMMLPNAMVKKGKSFQRTEFRKLQALLGPWMREKGFTGGIDTKAIAEDRIEQLWR